MLNRPLWLLLCNVTLGLGLGLGCDDKGGTDYSTDNDEEETDTSDLMTYDDADGDTILDIHEGEDDTDGDGLANYLDDDSDGDTIKDFIEAGDTDPMTLPVDSDSDGVDDYLDSDSDNNCISDEDEKIPTGNGPIDSDGDGDRDYVDDDNDGDGILDVDEIGSDCSSPDSDGDGTDDYMDEDSDNDGIADEYEAGTTEWDDDPVDTDEDGIPDYLDDDSDGDGISDTEESGVESTGEEPRDTDGDGTYDFQDTDSDGDSLTDDEELEVYGTDPYDSDTDGDGYSDGGEVTAETDPLDDTSVIDGIYVEVPERSTTEEEFDFELTIQMGDIAFLIDTTGSMGSTADAMAAEFASIVLDLATAIPDAEYGVATYDDYAYGSMGSAGTDKPFELRYQITDDTSTVQSYLASGLPGHSGADGPESSMEALYQGATGDGYDQGCDGTFNNTYDVPPFLSDSSDPFGGTATEAYTSSLSGGGPNGGFGFRDYALPIMIYATDYDLRDPDAGYQTPGGCFVDAGASDVVAALSDLGGYIIGVHVNNYTQTPYNQMMDLAAATNSYADTDGDGVADDELVTKWSGSSATFRTTITDAVEDLVSSLTFEQVGLEVEGDEWGFVTSISPDYYEDIDTSSGSQELEFTLDFLGNVAATTEDQLFKLTLNVIGDETVLLDSMDIIVVVPGTSY